MTISFAGPIRRVAAFAILLLFAWIAFQTLGTAIQHRISLGNEIKELQGAYRDIESRRADVRVLERQLSDFATASAKSGLAIVAGGERAATAQLHQIIRKRVQEARGRLVALTEISPATGKEASIVSAHLRLRINDMDIASVLHSLDGELPRMQIREVSIIARNQAQKSPLEVDVATIVQANWILSRSEIEK